MLQFFLKIAGAAQAEMIYTPVSFIKGAQNPGDLVLGFYKYAIGIVGIVALGAIIYGAVLRMISSGDAGKIKDSNSWIMGAVWGMALLLGASLILSTINPQLVQIGEISKSIETGLSEKLEKPTSTSFGNCQDKFGEIVCEKIAYDPKTGKRTKSICGEGYMEYDLPEGMTGCKPVKNASLNPLEEDTARANLKSAGVNFKRECAANQKTDCVRFQDINEKTLAEVMSFPADLKCKDSGSGKLSCPIFITGGTENGHADGQFSHGNGYKLDVAPNTQLDTYIKGKFNLSGYTKDVDGTQLPTYVNPATGAQWVFEPQKTYTDKNGIQKTRGAHWDILVK
ncbi:MAG: hypothetical protein QMD86_01600 [Patescibacteria group bacterium]|nr:hypothetical protein [Patescibacteria group bacterium]